MSDFLKLHTRSERMVGVVVQVYIALAFLVGLLAAFAFALRFVWWAFNLCGS